MKRILISTLILSLLAAPALAQEEASVKDRVISGTFKTVAKAFIATSNMEKLKEDNIKKVAMMDNDKFARQSARAYDVLKNLPGNLISSYGISENITKAQVVRNIKSLDKKKAYEIIDAIPDTVIADKFRQYLSKKKQEIQESTLVEQVNGFFRKIIDRE